jgi:hypothetical protein
MIYPYLRQALLSLFQIPSKVDLQYMYLALSRIRLKFLRGPGAQGHAGLNKKHNAII